ncbi:acyl-CoA thioesterase [Algoriphagus hitonicola]|uniref:Acyl-CoA thioester hydrolase n=1 Tax=Algoriphagus hitonicola TaxID=435880 RepID=A0A1I2WCB9_9BACT|nr:thioesterase family protein [Algoriphagus hitonicola]SFG98349.1 acyl-CoA thioester hydrolase [Algoriphagus hitonicola]
MDQPNLADFHFFTPIQIRFSDIDGYMHVNNGVYFNYFEHARADFLYRHCDWNIMETGTVVAKIEINYFRPVHLHDQLKIGVRVARIGNSSFALEQVLFGNDGSGKDQLFASCHCVMVSVNMKNMKPVSIPVAQRAKLEEMPEKTA